MTETLTIAQFYLEGKNSGKVLGLICDKGHTTVPPRHSCRVCNSTQLTVKELTGRGKIVSFTEVYAKSKDFPLATPYTLALVELEEGGNLLGVLDEKGTSLGAKVKVNFRIIRSDSAQPTIFFQRI
ncbi:MAG: Zn-ribbon domain-containing OB-fold protein [archaeon]|nr:Zn-ribbon domain-containing OB-fold protein [archaeon]